MWPAFVKVVASCEPIYGTLTRESFTREFTEKEKEILRRRILGPGHIHDHIRGIAYEFKLSVPFVNMKLFEVYKTEYDFQNVYW